jgi:hypothetical protein
VLKAAAAAASGGGGKAAEGDGEEEQQQQDGGDGDDNSSSSTSSSGTSNAGEEEEWPELPRLKDRAKDMARRISPELVAAFVEAEVIGRQRHRGSGDRPYARPDTAPAFEGLTLDEFDATKEGELSALARRAAEAEDDLQWREFRRRMLYNLGLVRFFS